MPSTKAESAGIARYSYGITYIYNGLTVKGDEVIRYLYLPNISTNMQAVYFQVKSRLGVKIRITTSYWNFIIESKHTTMSGKETLVKTTLRSPDLIKRSIKDRSVFLYYKGYKKDFAVVVCKHLNGSGYIITTYITDRIKIGEQIWKKPR